MRRITLLAVAAVATVGSGIAVVGTQVHAQGAPPGPGMERPDREAGMRRAGEDGAGRWHMRGMMRRMRQFALVYPAVDRNLSGPDVQKIAEGFLLFNGNHTWKVTDVAEQGDRVTFALAAPDGTAIAHFAMNRHTARPERLD